MMQQEDKSSQTITNFTPVNWDLFKVESERLKSFDNWTVPFIDKNMLAAAGFVYFNNGDMVQCVFCKVQIGNWANGDDPLLEHFRMSPCCRFLMKLPVGNIPINSDSELVIPQMSHRSYDTCGRYGMLDVPQRGDAQGGLIGHSIQELCATMRVGEKNFTLFKYYFEKGTWKYETLMISQLTNRGYNLFIADNIKPPQIQLRTISSYVGRILT